MTDTAQKPEKICWVVTDGRTGIETQALGLAEAVAELTPLSIEVKRIKAPALWNDLASPFGGDPLKMARGDRLAPPWPDLWIACGRLSVPLSIAMRRTSPATRVVQLQNPRVPAALFNLVIAPAHDRLSGPNIVTIIGSTMRAANRHRARAGNGKDRHLAVLVGGPNRAFRFNENDAAALGGALSNLADDGFDLSVTTSRRTPVCAARILEDMLAGRARVFWRADCGQKEENPYPAMLDDAGAVLVTEDSVNMAAEAATSGAPVYVYPLRRKLLSSAAKFDAFHESLIARGAARRYEGKIERFDFDPIDETKRAAAAVIGILG